MTPTVRTLRLGDVANFICALVQESRHLYPFFFSPNGDAPRQVEIRWGDPRKAFVFQRNPDDNSYRYILTEDGKEVTQFTAQAEAEEIEAFSFGAKFFKLLGEKIDNSHIAVDMFIHAISALTQKEDLEVEVVY